MREANSMWTRLQPHQAHRVKRTCLGLGIGESRGPLSLWTRAQVPEAPRGAPVSYTHLRAHETSAHL
eukprot:9261184-Alexandrium_andersonii.AAC.1